MLTAGRDAMVAYLFGECPGDTPLYDAQIGAVKRAYKAIRALKNSPQGDQNADPQEAESALPVKADREEGPRPAKHAAPVGSAPCVARQTLTSSRWSADGELIWWIEGEEISDSDLRKWCANNMAGPNRYVDVIRECHVRAYSQRERRESK